MILNHEQPAVKQKLNEQGTASSLAGAVITAVAACSDPFEAETAGAGLEIAARTPLPNGLANRARMKIFSPKPGHTLVFFFKKSLVPYSRDRYSYGGLDLRSSSVDGQEIDGWLDFMSSGFHPDKRPGNLRRAFPYDLPE